MEPYTEAELDALRSHPDGVWESPRDDGMAFVPRDHARWLATVDALQARLAAAEGLLGKARRLLHEPSMFSREKLDACVERIDAHLAAAPAPGPEGGEVAR